VALAGVAAALFAGSLLMSGVIRWDIQRKLDHAYGKGLKIARLEIRLFPRISATGDDVVYRPGNRTGVPPLLTIRKFSAETNWFFLVDEHVREVRLDGLVIVVPPRKDREEENPKVETSHVVVDRIVADGAVLRVLPKKEGKEPLEFDLSRLTLKRAGTQNAMQFTTIMKNAEPPGEIQSSGNFGPWRSGDPALTPVSGSYTFDDADLGAFKGIAGTLSSRGKYDGTLDHIAVSGAADVPDFSLRVSGQQLHLTTEFQAVVDGINGNTLLDSVNGRLGDTDIETHGSVDRKPGDKAKTVSLDAVVRHGDLADLLRLAMPGKPSMSGAISFTTKILIPPDDVDIAEKLGLDGHFTIAQAEFSKLNVQEKVNELSHRGSGAPKEPPEENVASNFRGSFHLARGTITFSDLTFEVPGVSVALAGTYALETHRIDMHGQARLRAKLSQATTGVTSILLKMLDPFLASKNAGAVIPIRIGGTAQSPSFGLGSKG